MVFLISRRMAEYEYRGLRKMKRFVIIVIENLMNISMIVKVGRFFKIG